MDGEGGGGGGGDTRNAFATFSFRATPESTIGVRYRHPLEWTAAWNSASRQVTVMRPTGSSISFLAPAGSADAHPSGSSRKLNYQVQLLNEDKTPCTGDEPFYMDMVQSSGRILRFAVSTGKVSSLISSSGVETTAEQYAQQLQITRNPVTGAIESVWSKSQGLLQTIPDGSRLTLAWYAPEQVKRNIRGAFYGTDTPWKTISYEETKVNGVSVMQIDEQREGMPVFHTERRVEGNNVTIITGEGDARIVRTIERSFLPGGKWEMIETYRRMDAEGNISDDFPASCVRTVKKNTAGGWLTLSRTEGYGTPEAQTTLFTYNEQFRRILVIQPNGGYTRYEYDDRGRTTLEATPWAGGGERATRTTYADLRFNDFRPATETELILDEDGFETVLSQRLYTYEDSPEVNRTTVTETALGSDNVHTTVSEVNGPGAAYPYARGRERFRQGINGIQTLVEYAPTTAHGAIHAVISTVQVAGAPVPGRSTRDIQYIAGNGTTTRSERYVHTGEEWTLISAENYEYDVELKRTRTTRANGHTGTTEWMCCGPLRETDEDGITTTYGYNTAKQLIETIRSATETTPEIIVSYTRDAADRVLATRRDTGPMTTVESSVYDPVGRIVATTDILGRTTHTAYSEDLLVTTVTVPSGATFITQAYYDGTPVLQSGTGQRSIETRVELTEDGILTTRLTGSVVLSRRLENGFGETVREDIPNTQEGWISTQTTWNAKGQTIRRQTGQMAPTLTAYDELGQAIRQIVILDQKNPDDPSANRITDQSVAYAIHDDGIYQIQITTTYNAAGHPLVQSTEQLVSSLSAALEDRRVSTDIYGKQRIDWAEYTAPSQRTVKIQLPTSDIVAEQLVIDDYTVTQKDPAGVTTTQSRSYTATGLTLRQTDARGNTITTQTDLAGRPVSVTDAAGNTTATDYNPYFDKPSRITNALGSTVCYIYDHRGRKTAEYGTAIQPACFSYDEADQLISLTTFRVDTGDITTDPSDRTDGDITRWVYHNVTGLELEKIAPDGNTREKTYNQQNLLATLTKSRGTVTTYTYSPLTGAPISATHSDGTPSWEIEYNHLGQSTHITDASGRKIILRDPMGNNLGEQQQIQDKTITLLDRLDENGRYIGYDLTSNVPYVTSYASTTIDYAPDGRIATLITGDVLIPFTWNYDAESGLLNELTYPNGIVRNNIYHSHKNLLSCIDYHTPDNQNTAAKHEYQYDQLDRPTQRQDTWNTLEPKRTHHYTYNYRGELTNAILEQDNFAYSYDNIGNRKIADEPTLKAQYSTNALNQYTSIAEIEKIPFIPEHDADGNQTKIRTSTGIWDITYNADDRPIRFENADKTCIVECAYDCLGRRYEKKITENGTTIFHARYIYRGYLQIAEISLLSQKIVKTYTWDPVEPTATRLLSMANWNATGTVISDTLYYMYDAQKNVTILFGRERERRARYEYRPYGALIRAEGDVSLTNKFRHSCEYSDDELGLIYYNYRHYNPEDGRWISRDPIQEQGGLNLYAFVGNMLNTRLDYLGLGWWSRTLNAVGGALAVAGGIALISSGAALTAGTGGLGVVGGVILVGIGAVMIAQGASSVISSVMPEETNYLEKGTKYAFEYFGADPNTGKTVYQATEVATSLITLRCGVKMVQIAVKGKYLKETYETITGIGRYGGIIRTKVFSREYSIGIRAVNGADVVTSVRTIIIVVSNWIEEDPKPEGSPPNDASTYPPQEDTPTDPWKLN